MLKIRLQRVGRKNNASFRVVVIESQRGPKAGNALEVLGFYDPKKDVIEIKGDRVTHWISVGAQVSDTVHNLLVKEKIIKGEKINVLPKKSPIKKEGEDQDKESGEENKPAAAVGSGVAKPASTESSGVAKEETEKKPEKADDKKEVPAFAKSLSADRQGSGEVKEKQEEKKEDDEEKETKKEEEKQPAVAKSSGVAKPAAAVGSVVAKKEDEKKS